MKRLIKRIFVFLIAGALAFGCFAAYMDYKTKQRRLAWASRPVDPYFQPEIYQWFPFSHSNRLYFPLRESFVEQTEGFYIHTETPSQPYFILGRSDLRFHPDDYQTPMVHDVIAGACRLYNAEGIILKSWEHDHNYHHATCYFVRYATADELSDWKRRPFHEREVETDPFNIYSRSNQNGLP